MGVSQVRCFTSSPVLQISEVVGYLGLTSILYVSQFDTLCVLNFTTLPERTVKSDIPDSTVD